MYIKLQKTNERGGIQIWEAEVTATDVIITHGQEGGKMQVKTKPRSSWKPKNVGKKNEMSSDAQSLFETIRTARKKLEEKYSLVEGDLETIESNTSKTVVKSNTEVPNPTLAKNASPSSKDHTNSMRKIIAQGSVLVQRKLDGNRSLINRKNGEVYSRKRKLIISLPHLGEQVIKACKDLPDDVEFVDGELFSSELTFNEIQSIVRKSKPTAEDFETAKAIRFNMFDFVSYDEQVDRIDLMNVQVVENEYVKVVETFDISSEDIEEYHDRFVEEGNEGIIIRFKRDGGYQQKRSNSMYKFKKFDDAEFPIIKIYSEKNDVTKLGGMTLIMDDGTEFDARPSCTQEETQYIMDNPNEFIGKLATVRYQKLDDVSGVPIFGTIKGFRAENDIEVTDED